MTKHISLRFTLLLMAIDLLLVVAALLLSTLLRIHVPLGMAGKIDVWILPLPVYLLGIVAFGISFNAVGVYDPRHSLRLSIELQNIAMAILIAWLVFIGVIYLTYRDVSRLQVIYVLVLYAGLVFGFRLCTSSGNSRVR